METKQDRGDNMSLEESLTDLVLKPRAEKVRRPPNAFMLFAREHRKIIASRHPDVSNKVVSSMLGKIWKGSAQNVKQKYFKKAQMLDKLHKIQYPDYVYSPREARLQKMNRKRKKDETLATSVVNKEDMKLVMKISKEEVKPKEENKKVSRFSETEDWTANTSEDKSNSLDYVPNNPEYFTEECPEFDTEEPPNLQPCTQYSSEFHEGYAETEETSLTPYIKEEEDETSHHFQNPPHFSYSTSSPFYNTSAHFPGPISSCCGPTPCSGHLHRPYAPPFHPYWSSSFMNTHCHRNRNCAFEDMNSFPFRAPYHDPDYCRSPFGYLQRPVAPPARNASSGFYPYFNENWDHFRHLRNDFVTDNPGSCPFTSRSNEKGQNSSNLCACSPPNGKGLNLQNESQFQNSKQQDKKPSASISESGLKPLETSNPYQHSVNNESNPLIQITEDERKESSTNEYFVGNQNSYDSRKNKNEEYLADANNRNATMSETGSESLTSPYIVNTSNSPSQCNVTTEKANSPDALDQKFSNFVTLEPEPHIQIMTGKKAPLYTTTYFQEMCKRQAHIMENALMPVDYINRPSVVMSKLANEIDSSRECKGFIMNNNHNMHLQSLCTDDNMNLQTSEENFDTVNVTNFENFQKVETINKMLDFQPRFSHPLIKEEVDEPSFSSSNGVNKSKIPTNRRLIINNNEQTHFPQAVTKSGIYTATPTEQRNLKDGHRKISYTYSKNLADNLKATQDFMETAELGVDKYSQRCAEQKDLPKMYYEQKDGSYVAEENFICNTVKSKVQKLILNDSLVTVEKAEKNGVCSQKLQ